MRRIIIRCRANHLITERSSPVPTDENLARWVRNRLLSLVSSIVGFKVLVSRGTWLTMTGRICGESIGSKPPISY